MKAALTRRVWEMAGRCCEYCRMPQLYDRDQFEIDHIVSCKHDGETIASNLALSCYHCNSHKGSDIAGRDFATRRLVPLFHPRRHKWHRHFRWRGAELVGRTAIGRVTVVLLQINDPFRIQLREELIREGIFPPT